MNAPLGLFRPVPRAAQDMHNQPSYAAHKRSTMLSPSMWQVGRHGIVAPERTRRNVRAISYFIIITIMQIIIVIRTRCPVKHVPIDFDGSHGNEVIRVSLGLLSGVHGGSGSTTYTHTYTYIYIYIYICYVPI